MGEFWPPPSEVVDAWRAGIAEAAARHPDAAAEMLSELLYREVHLCGTWKAPSGPDDELIALLHNVLRSDRYVSPGWLPRTGNEVARNGVRLLVTDADIAERGETFAILLPRIRPRIALGRHVLIGAAGPPDDLAGRIYLNPADAAGTWASMATAADATGLPWQATFRTDRSDRDRPDRIVLACDPTDLGPLLGALSAVATADPVPGFAYRRGPGLAIAVTPEDSFGRFVANTFMGTPTDG